MNSAVAACLRIGAALAGTISAVNLTFAAVDPPTRMVIIFKPAEVKKFSPRAGERIDNVFPDQRYAENPALWKGIGVSTQMAIRDIENRYSVKTLAAFGAFSHGLAAELTPGQVRALRADPLIETVFRDAVGALASWDNIPAVSTSSTFTKGWNIFAIGADTTLSYRTDGGYPVKAFVLDSGVAQHSDLNLNGFWNFDTHGNYDQYGNACSPHATHVAGIIGGYRSPAQTGIEGVAPGAQIWSMRVINYCGAGYPGLVYTSSVLSAINAIDSEATPRQAPMNGKQRLRAVANISILWDTRVAAATYMDQAARDALRTTMTTAVFNGVFFSVAGGNSLANSCSYYPSAVGSDLWERPDYGNPASGAAVLRYGTAGVVSVGAIRHTGAPMDFQPYGELPKIASYGPCTHIWAPGQSVHSTVVQTGAVYPNAPAYTPWGPVGGGWVGMQYYEEQTGSSMAAPHIAGAALLFAKRKQQQGQPLPYPEDIRYHLLQHTVNYGTYGPPGESGPINLINVSGW